MSKDGKDAELMKLTEDDCTLIREALRCMKQQFYRAKGELPYVADEIRALVDAQVEAIDVVKEKVWFLEDRLYEQRAQEKWEKEKAERV